MNKSPPEKEDELLLAASRGLLAWSSVEDAMFQLFLQVTPGWQGPIIWDAVISFDARLKVLNQLVLHVLQDNPAKPVWVKLAARIAKFYKKRHELAHFDVVWDNEPWSGKPSNPAFVPFSALASVLHERGALTTQQMEERAEKFTELRDAVMYFLGLITWQRGSTLEYREQAPRLIDHLRTLVAQTPEAPEGQLEPSDG